MKKILALCAALALSVVMVLPVAAANPGKGSATQFAVTYTAPTDATTWTCTGTHIVNKNVTKDNETCVISGDLTGFVAGTYIGSPTGTLPPFGSGTWTSDDNGATAASWTIVEVDNGTTFTLNIVAIY